MTVAGSAVPLTDPFPSSQGNSVILSTPKFWGYARHEFETKMCRATPSFPHGVVALSTPTREFIANAAHLTPSEMVTLMTSFEESPADTKPTVAIEERRRSKHSVRKAKQKARKQKGGAPD